jgi:hypothetical protein
MKRILGILLCAIILSAPISQSAAHEGCHAVRIEGKKARKNYRHKLYLKMLKGDKRAIYKRHGFTPNRLRVDHGFGEITEIWTYHDKGLEFTFDNESRLIERHSIPKEDRSVSYY